MLTRIVSAVNHFGLLRLPLFRVAQRADKEKAKELNAVLNQTKRAEQLLDLYREESKRFDCIHYSTLLKQLLKAKA